MNIFIILPTQLFEYNEYNEYLDKMDNIYIIEEPFYFTSKSFHKQKLILHRASMKYYYDKLNPDNCVTYNLSKQRIPCNDDVLVCVVDIP